MSFGMCIEAGFGLRKAERKRDEDVRNGRGGRSETRRVASHLISSHPSSWIPILKDPSCRDLLSTVVEQAPSRLSR